ncbi:D-aminoacyl-tRNA deacylase [Candidatus Neptunichlamydia sp. REUL1]|uniref:D-aminoacyl-tRNA deacylase n=1 Tax=Candidatus Neptunichlamydia sp. REUL1 TaxID=3064277 RepID=UPI0029319F1A|nr:D-aminoacyl-tRNA deacylase [Candidatus Neptunochlamydia sp. REUL1]
MRVLIQRVKEARVTVEEKVVGEISGGLLLFLGIHKDDREEKIPWLVNKIVNMRIFEDDQGKMNRSIIDAQGRILVVSQFTLYGDCDKGRRPSFTETMPPTQARLYYESFAVQLRYKMGADAVEMGSFGSHMEVHLVNNGPVTFLLSR